MSRLNKFSNFKNYFAESTDDEVEMTLEQIEYIIKGKLCASAYEYKEYWYPDKTHSFPNCWINNGYKMTYLNLDEQKVKFAKLDSNQEKVLENKAKTNVKNVSFAKKYPTISVDKVILSISKFYSDLEADENARYLSWEHCYKQFLLAHQKNKVSDDDIDNLSLNLAFYLASWGMYRGSSFLLQKDYRVHKDIIKKLFEPKYEHLWFLDFKGLQDTKNHDVLMELINTLKVIYEEKRKTIKNVETDISDILTTKVLLGTLGCVPAYDEYFKKGIGKFHIATQSLGISSLMGLACYYEDNKIRFEEIREKISYERHLLYPQMKIIDMAFWQLGYDNTPKKERAKIDLK